jgi:hypothetical protein
VTGSWSVWALYLLGFAVLLMPLTPHGISLLPLPLLATAGCVVLAWSHATAGEHRSAGLTKGERQGGTPTRPGGTRIRSAVPSVPAEPPD